MDIDSLTHSISGVRRVPESNEEWNDWVSATRTRNFTLSDPLLDWLNLYGSDHGFQRDDELDGYDPRTDFRQFIFAKGHAFETAVVSHLETLAAVYEVPEDEERSRSLPAAEQTCAAMQRGENLIYQAVLRDAETRTFGAADLLIRSDELHRLFPGTIPVEESTKPAPHLGDVSWHYRVVDIKFTNLHFYAGGGLSDVGSAWPFKQQVFIYNRALGRLQGYLPPEAHLLGRGWQQTVKGETSRGASCMERLGSAPHDYVSRSKGSLADAVDSAYTWIRRVRKEGANWQVLPSPSVPELRPNLVNTSDHPWHAAKQRIGQELQDLTGLWQVGLSGRQAGIDAGVSRWSDPKCNAAVLGVTGTKRAPTLDAILNMNRSDAGPSVRPSHVHAAEQDWRVEPRLEFYVDFETVSDLDDDFSRVPHKGGQPLIFMVGCGHVEYGEWRWSCFTADAMTQDSEAEVIDAWFTHMADVKSRLDPNGDEPTVFHWSHAEESTLVTAFNSAKNRHPDKAWASPAWFDFLQRVVREEPVVVRGAFGFGLKAVAKAMHEHGFIETEWDAGPTDGLGAMVGAWSCVVESAERGCTLPETKLMQEIAAYNEVDCKVMMEIVRYLRINH